MGFSKRHVAGASLLFTRFGMALLLLPCSFSVVHAQAKYTAERTGDLQIGVDFVGGTSDYVYRVKGVGVYSTFNLTNHWGAEFDLHQADEPVASVYERTYEIGGRYVRSYGRVSPYGKFMIGRGVFNFPQGRANLAYNMFAFGGGADVKVTRYLNVRGDYEYQDWRSFSPHGLTPQLFTIGVAYHFPGGLARGKHY